MKKVLPLFSSDSSQMRPPCWSMIFKTGVVGVHLNRKYMACVIAVQCLEKRLFVLKDGLNMLVYFGFRRLRGNGGEINCWNIRLIQAVPSAKGFVGQNKTIKLAVITDFVD